LIYKRRSLDAGMQMAFRNAANKHGGGTRTLNPMTSQIGTVSISSIQICYPKTASELTYRVNLPLFISRTETAMPTP
jgi:hypothetical protein